MLSFFSSIANVFSAIIDAIVSIIDSIINVVTWIGQGVTFLIDFFGGIFPAAMLTLLVSLLAVVVIYKILGRD